MKKIYLLELAGLFKAGSKVPKWLRKDIPVQTQLKMLREALGMTQRQLAKRVGLKQNAIAMFEKDSHADFQLSTLIKLAKGLHAEVIVNIVPMENLNTLVARRAQAVGRKLMKVSRGSTAIELQLPGEKHNKHELKKLVAKILENHKGVLWEED
jgi:transcriptional regulator with XRE-family HTH domain